MEEINSRLSPRFVVCTCLVTCLIALGSSIYCTYILYLVRNVQNELTSLQGDLTGQEQPAMVKYATENGYQKNKEIVEFSEEEHVLSRNKRAVRHKKCKCPKTLAAHYEQKFTPAYFKTTFKEYNDRVDVDQVHFIDTVRGIVHSNGDFQSVDYPLKIFQLAPGWKEKSSPFKRLENDGKFIAKKSGTYLVYVQALISDKKRSQEIKIVHRRGNETRTEYSCVRGLEKPAKEPVSNTCSITSLLRLQKNDYIRIELEDVNIKLNLSRVNTYFGAILLR